MRPRNVLAASALSIALVVAPTAVLAQGLMLTGYGDFETVVDNIGSGGTEFYFDNHHFNLIAVGNLFKDVFASAEIEYEHGGAEIALEYGFIAYTGLKNVTIAAGKFIVPFGRFNKDLHPTWINKIPGRPNGFSNIMPGTYSDVGIWISGAAPLGPNSGGRFVYDAFVVNGLLGDDGAGIRGMRGADRDNGPVGGRDNNKAVGGRLGFELPPQGFDFGASLYFGNYLDDPVLSENLVMFGFDAAYRNSGLEIRAEGISAKQGSAGGDLTKTGGYAQIAYLTSAQFEPVVRFSLRNMPGDGSDASRVSFGGSYYLSPNSAVRLAYSVNIEKTGFEADNDKLVAQFTVMF